jgi:hypothetical protein
MLDGPVNFVTSVSVCCILGVRWFSLTIGLIFSLRLFEVDSSIMLPQGTIRSYWSDVSFPETAQFTLGRSHFEIICPTSNDGSYRLAAYTSNIGIAQVWHNQPPCLQLSVLVYIPSPNDRSPNYTNLLRQKTLQQIYSRKCSPQSYDRSLLITIKRSILAF